MQKITKLDRILIPAWRYFVQVHVLLLLVLHLCDGLKIKISLYLENDNTQFSFKSSLKKFNL